MKNSFFQRKNINFEILNIFGKSNPICPRRRMFENKIYIDFLRKYQRYDEPKTKSNISPLFEKLKY